jgi:hypothetical protein
MAIFPDEKYSEQLLYTLLSNLLELMNGFLAQIEFENNELAQKRLAMKALRNRKESKQWLSVKKQYDLISSKQNKIDSSALLESKLYFTELDEHFISKQLREEDPNLQSSSDKLDEFYFAEKLRLACDIISRNIVIKADYKSFELDSILRLIDANSEKFIKIPSVAVYRSILKMLTDEKSSYTETVFIIKSNQKYFKVEELKTQFDSQLQSKESELGQLQEQLRSKGSELTQLQEQLQSKEQELIKLRSKESELNQLTEVLKKSATLKPVLVTEKSTQTLLSMPFLLLLLMVALSLEWGIRRYIGIY